MTHMGFETRRMCMAELTYNQKMSHHTYVSDGFCILFRNLTHVWLLHDVCQIGDHVIMTRRLVIQKVDSLFRFVLTIKNHVFTIQPSIDDDTVICIILLESF